MPFPWGPVSHMFFGNYVRVVYPKLYVDILVLERNKQKKHAVQPVHFTDEKNGFQLLP